MKYSERAVITVRQPFGHFDYSESETSRVRWNSQLVVNYRNSVALEREPKHGPYEVVSVAGEQPGRPQNNVAFAGSADQSFPFELARAIYIERLNQTGFPIRL